MLTNHQAQMILLLSRDYQRAKWTLLSAGMLAYDTLNFMSGLMFVLLMWIVLVAYSALDIFGGDGVTFEECVAWNNNHQQSSGVHDRILVQHRQMAQTLFFNMIIIKADNIPGTQTRRIACGFFLPNGTQSMISVLLTEKHYSCLFLSLRWVTQCLKW